MGCARRRRPPSRARRRCRRARRRARAPLARALGPPGALQVLFSRFDMIASPWSSMSAPTRSIRRSRVEAIAPDHEAGSAGGDAVHPAIESMAEDLARATRILLIELLSAGLLTIELVELADTEKAGTGERRFVDPGPLALAQPRRACRPARRGAPAHTAGFRQRPRSAASRGAVDCRDAPAALVAYLVHNGFRDSLFVRHRERTATARRNHVARRFRTRAVAQGDPPNTPAGRPTQQSPRRRPICPACPLEAVAPREPVAVQANALATRA